MTLFEKILQARGLKGDSVADFLSPDYEKKHDPFLLPDMLPAVERLVLARERQEKIVIYGDYDIDGLTATTLLVDAFSSFGFLHIDTYIPNRFVEGYGLTIDAVEDIAQKGTQLIVTVDCGSLSHKEVARANELGVDVIVTDHHTVADTSPPAVATINPKRSGHDYPFIDLAGVGVAFKLVQALQTRLDGLPKGSEKWLLDLVALGTVCDVVSLVDENRTNVYWGLKVLAKTRRPGLRALMAVATVFPDAVTSRTLGFALGPRMNAAGRLETALFSLELLLSTDNQQALEKAQQLDELNKRRRADQDTIFKEAIIQADTYHKHPVLVLSGKEWNHGVVGIVAAKILEKYKKPTYILQEMGETAKGSARSFGDFSAVAAIRASDDIITKGGGHTLAAGVTLPTERIEDFRTRVNEFYKSLKLKDQAGLLLKKADAVIDTFAEINKDFIEQIAQLEPFGSANPEPLLEVTQATVARVKTMGDRGQHLKLSLIDTQGVSIDMVAFGAPEYFFVDEGQEITAVFHPLINEWRGQQTIEGRIVDIYP